MPTIQIKRDTDDVVSATKLLPGELAAALDTGNVYVGKTGDKLARLLNDDDVMGFISCDDAAITDPVEIDAGSIGPVDLKATKITFTDGETLQAKLEAGKLQGDKGATGEPGPKGDKGDDGVKGDTGDTGSIGPAGKDGAQGPAGVNGIKGDTGSVGPKGDKGDLGIGGPRGPSGPQGKTGLRGVDCYDVVIRTQAEFEALIASPTWLDAVSVCFVGDGGNLKFIRSDGKGCLIPQTVKQIQGMNSAIIEVKNFIFNNRVNQAVLWYETLLTSDDYWINGITVNCTNNNTGIDTYTFKNCTNVTNCTGTGTGTGTGIGFYNCTQLTNCTGTGTGTGTGFGFNNCTQLTNCIGTGTGTGTGTGIGFNNCTQLTNCIGTTGTGTGTGYGYGFNNCTQLTNCTGTGTGTGTGIGIGFYNCTQLTNCIGTGTGNGTGSIYGYGFYNCNYLNSCNQGTASTTAFLGGTNTKVDTLTVMAS